MDPIKVTMDWLHLLATVTWIGGMAFNVLVLRPSIATIEPLTQRINLVSAVLNRFIRVAWGCILVLIVTGIFIAESSKSSTYKDALIVKHVIVSVMILIVAMIHLILFPQLKAFLSKPTEPTPELMKLLGQIVLLVKLNLSLGVFVLLITAILGEA